MTAGGEPNATPATGGAPSGGGPRWVIFLAVLTPLSLVAAAAAYFFGGAPALAASGLGFVFGLAVLAINLGLARALGGADGKSAIRGLLAGTFFSLGSFVAGLLVLRLVWRDAIVPAVLTAMVVYLTVKFIEVGRAARGQGGRDALAALPPAAGAEGGGRDRIRGDGEG